MNSQDYRKKIYDTYASGYKQESLNFNREAAEKWGRAYDWYLQGFLPEDKKASILEPACGNGAFLYYLKSRGYENIRGVDISPEQVQLSRQVIPDVIEDDIIHHLTTSEAAYDLIVALDIIEHLFKDEALQFIDCCTRALQPGGRLILQTTNADSPLASSTFCSDFTHETLFSPAGLERLLHVHGYTDIRARETGPVVNGAVSAVRYVLWHMVRQCIKCYNRIETGNSGRGIFTRVFIISGVKS